MNEVLKLDPGHPFPVVGADGRVVLIETFTCAGQGCSSTNLHLRVIPAVEVARGYELDDSRAAVVLWNVATGALSTHGGEASEALARVADASTIEAWIADHADPLRARFERHRAKADSTLRTRPLPDWKPGARLYHGELFPDFTPYVTHGGRSWFILDAYCPDPTCPCLATTLWLRRMGGEVEEELEVVLGRPKPLKASASGRALWRAILADRKLVARLQRRRAEVRFAGTFVTANAYERARRETTRRNIERRPSAEGYLQGGEISASAIARMFEAMRTLEAADTWDCLPPNCMLRADVSGPVSGTAWVLLDTVTESVDLLDAPVLDEGAAFTSLSLDQRIDVPWDYLRERCAYDWPLASSGEVPILARAELDGSVHPLAPAETLRAIATCAAFVEHLSAIRELGRRHERGESVGPESWESVIALDEGDVHVRLTASDASAPWPAAQAQESDEGHHESGDAEDDEADDEEDDDAELGDDGGDDDPYDDEAEWDEDEENELDPYESVRVAREAFCDWALTCGSPLDDIALASDLVTSIADYVHDAHPEHRWYEATILEGFLTRYAPRKVALDEGAIERTQAALELLVGWLAEAGHLDAGGAATLRKLIVRAAATFRKRMRDPSAFGLAKGLFAEMERAGVDVSDEQAIERYTEAKNRASALAVGAPSRDARERSPHRWRPAEGEQPPAPAEPCPCGSGRRYKKCCKPR